MKYYVGYFNKPWDKSEFTVICGTPSSGAALFILERYREHSSENMKDIYTIVTAAEAMDLKLIFE